MLFFQLDDFKQAHEECLERFSDDLLICASLHAVKELFLAGRQEYVTVSGYRFGFHNSLGFRLLAANVLAIMIKKVIEDKNNGAYVECGIEGLDSDFEKSESFLKHINDHALQDVLNEPALGKWSDLFQIPFVHNVNINDLYYINQN